MTVPVTGSADAQDPGLQPERTVLSWRRSLMAMIVADFFIWRAWVTGWSESSSGVLSGRLWGLGLAAAAAAASTVILAGCLIYRGRNFRSAQVEEAPAVLMKTAAGGIVALAASVGLSVLLNHT